MAKVGINGLGRIGRANAQNRDGHTRLGPGRGERPRHVRQRRERREQREANERAPHDRWVNHTLRVPPMPVERGWHATCRTISGRSARLPWPLEL
jgi:hypothetical protein